MRRTILFLLAATFCLAAMPLIANETLPLAGEWRFALDRNDAGTNESWFGKTLPEQIHLPGILEAQGYGDEISLSTPWVLSLYDHFWFLRADYSAYTNAGNVKVPFLCQPPRHYVGAAWYQRDIEVPQAWDGKRVALFLERPHWKSTVWIDDREIGSDISLCTPHEYEVGFIGVYGPGDSRHSSQIAPGKHRLTIRVDNRMILPYRPDAHSISDSLDDAWNGIIGKIELRATAEVWIENFQIFPNVSNKSFQFRASIGNNTGRPINADLQTFLDCFNGVTNLTPFHNPNYKFEVKPGGTNVEFEISMGDYYGPWNEFKPVLYSLTLRLEDEQDRTISDVKTGLKFHLSSGIASARATKSCSISFQMKLIESGMVLSWGSCCATAPDELINSMPTISGRKRLFIGAP